MKQTLPNNHPAFRIFVLQLLLFFLGSASAQESAFEANQQRMAILPRNVKNVSVVGDDLYCFSSGIVLKAQRSGEQLLGFWADTVLVNLEGEVEYVVSHPSTGDIYFTSRDRKGRSFLYRCDNFGEENMKAKQVRMGGGGWFSKGMTVEHPTFTDDGHILVFSSSDANRSEGGYDLWYSEFDGKHWSKPTNLGDRINTPYDEISPVIYHDCLIFSSNGHPEDNGHLSFYSTRLVSDRLEGDTVGMLQIGRCRVQRLPEPLNSSDADDFDMAIDTVLDCGYWVSNRIDVDTDSLIYSFSGALDGVLLWGTVCDKYDHPLAGVSITARQGDETVCNTTTDEDGRYRIYLRCNQYYELAYQLDDYFVAFEAVNTNKDEDEYLISEERLNVKLDRLPLGQRIHYDDLFGAGVEVELSERGRELLMPLVQFLIDNPEKEVKMTLFNDLTTDETFNTLLTDNRIRSLENYLYPLLPPTVKISLTNGCSGQERCSSASGMSRLTVLIDN